MIEFKPFNRYYKYILLTTLFVNHYASIFIIFVLCCQKIMHRGHERKPSRVEVDGEEDNASRVYWGFGGMLCSCEEGRNIFVEIKIKPI